MLRAKQTHSAAFAAYGVPPTAYGVPAQYGFPPAQPQPAQPVPAGVHPGLSNLITSLDGAGLQKLLGAMQQQQQSPQAAAPGQQIAGLTPELARLLGGGGAQPPLFGQQAPQPAQQGNPYNGFGGTPNLASLLQTPGAAQPSGVRQQQVASHPQGHSGQPDMQEIMAQLAKYRR